MKSKRVAIYYRVSTDTQTVENQVLDLKRYCETREWVINPDHVFVDQGISAMKKRDKLDDVMALAKHRKIDVLLVWAYDRFARSTIHLISTLDELQSVGVDFVSFAQQIDTTTPAGRLFYTISAGFAEYERSMIVERTKAGLRRVKAQGRKLGRPEVPPDIRDKVLGLRKEGLSLSQIAARVTWVRASGKYGDRKETTISKAMVGKIVQQSSTNRVPNVA